MKSQKNLLFSIAIACTFASCTKDVVTSPANTPTYSTLADAKETQPAVQTAVSVNIDANIGGFLEALPANYAINKATTKYPLIIFAHGTGEKGNGSQSQLGKVSKNGLPHMLANKTFPASFTVDGKEYSFIVLSPQFKNQPNASQLNDMLDYAIQHYSIDTSRIYITGLSMGGGTTWHDGGLYRNRVTAIVPMAGASGLNDKQCKLMAQTGLPIWAFHNNGDPTVKVATTLNWFIHLNKYKPVVAPIKTIFNANAHDCWTKASDPNYRETINGKNVNIYEWMLSYHK